MRSTHSSKGAPADIPAHDESEGPRRLRGPFDALGLASATLAC